MRIKVITLEFSTLSGCFDDAPLQDFIKDKNVLNVRDHFFVRNVSTSGGRVGAWPKEP